LFLYPLQYETIVTQYLTFFTKTKATNKAHLSLCFWQEAYYKDIINSNPFFYYRIVSSQTHEEQQKSKLKFISISFFFSFLAAEIRQNNN